MKFIRHALVVALWALCGVALAVEMDFHWKVRYDRGLAALQRSDYRDAIVQLEGAIEELSKFAQGPGIFRTHVVATVAALTAAYSGQARYADAERIARSLVLNAEQAFGPDDPLVATSLDALGRVYVDQARYAAAEPLFRRSLAIREKVHRTSYRVLAVSLNELGGLLRQRGNYAEAESLLKRALAMENAVQSDSVVAQSLTNLGNVYGELGTYAQAEALHRRALSIWEKNRGTESASSAEGLTNLANVYLAQARFAEAETTYRRAIEVLEGALGPGHLRVGWPLNNLAAVYTEQGRYPEAESLHRRALAIREQTLGPAHPAVAQSLHNLALVLQDTRRYADAEPLYQRALTINEKAHGPNHPNVAYTLGNLANLRREQKRYSEAEELNRRALAVRETAFGPEHFLVASSLNNIGAVYREQGRYEEAAVVYRRSLAIFENKLGPEHPDAAEILDSVAELFYVQKKFADGLVVARRGTALLSQRFTGRHAAEESGGLAEQRKRLKGFERHVALLAADLQEASAHAAVDMAEAFQVAQLARASDTGEQVARMAARFASGSDQLAQLARVRQDAFARAQAVDGMLIRETSKGPAERNSQRERELRKELPVLKRQVAELDARLEREFPQYKELTDPHPLTVADAQTLVAADEALVVFLVAEKQAYVWALRRDAAAFQALSIERSELDALVRKLRAQLDLGSADTGPMMNQAFDVRAANELYRRIFAPIAPVLAGARHLMIVPDGPLASIPFALLVTEAPQGTFASLSQLAAQQPEAAGARYADVQWLIGSGRAHS